MFALLWVSFFIIVNWKYLGDAVIQYYCQLQPKDAKWWKTYLGQSDYAIFGATWK